MPCYDWADGSVDGFWDGRYGFSTVVVGAHLGNGCRIHEQYYVALVKQQQGFTTRIGFKEYNILG